jgi:peroxiredoxin
MPLKIGDTAPDFKMMNQDKKEISLADLRGKRIVLLFYPMDFSPVCTTEHCSFGPELGKIQKDANTVVFGVSCDHPFAHEAFKKQFHIPYDLLSDVTRRVSKAYDLFLGEEPFNCSKRGTVVIGPDGKIQHWHEQPVLEVRKVADLAKL